eukprot:2934386-Rhodomonas_salina.2
MPAIVKRYVCSHDLLPLLNFPRRDKNHCAHVLLRWCPPVLHIIVTPVVTSRHADSKPVLPAVRNANGIERKLVVQAPVLWLEILHGRVQPGHDLFVREPPLDHDPLPVAELAERDHAHTLFGRDLSDFPVNALLPVLERAPIFVVLPHPVLLLVVLGLAFLGAVDAAAAQIAAYGRSMGDRR